MTSYRYLDGSDDKLLDRNQNVTRQREPTKITRLYDSDGEQDREESSTGFRGRSQSLKYLNEPTETGSIPRSKSLRDVDTGDFDSVSARVSYVDSWNPINPVGRGRIARRIQSWENLDTDESNMSRSTENGIDRRSMSTSNSIRSQGYDGYTRNTSGNWRDERYEAYEVYSHESAQYSYGYDRDIDNQVR